MFYTCINFCSVSVCSFSAYWRSCYKTKFVIILHLFKYFIVRKVCSGFSLVLYLWLVGLEVPKARPYVLGISEDLSTGTADGPLDFSCPGEGELFAVPKGTVDNKIICCYMFRHWNDRHLKPNVGWDWSMKLLETFV